MSRKIIAVITDVLGDRVVIGESELNHSIKEHFQAIPVDILLELIERVLKDPTKIFEEKKLHQYHLFYRLDHSRFLVAVIKIGKTGNFFSTIYPTGNKVRNKHNRLKEIKQ